MVRGPEYGQNPIESLTVDKGFWIHIPGIRFAIECESDISSMKSCETAFRQNGSLFIAERFPLHKNPSSMVLHRKWTRKIRKVRDYDIDFLIVVTKTRTTCAVTTRAGPLSDLLRNFSGPTDGACFEQFANGDECACVFTWRCNRMSIHQIKSISNQSLLLMRDISLLNKHLITGSNYSSTNRVNQRLDSIRLADVVAHIGTTGQH